MKNLLIIVILIVLAGGAYWYFHAGKAGQSYKDATYLIEGNPVTLANGLSTGTPAGTVRYFGNDAEGDLNGDGIPDVAFLLTTDGGGSGTFYYVAAALGTKTGYTGTNAVFVGDRIAPQTTEIKDGQITVNYADRAPEEPMTAQPSVGKSMYLTVSGGTLAEVSPHGG
jgi:hypothetical protein